jgi:hypothetical protein
MPTLPRPDCMIEGRAGRKRAQRLRWNTERAKEKNRHARKRVDLGWLGDMKTVVDCGRYGFFWCSVGAARDSVNGSPQSLTATGTYL